MSARNMPASMPSQRQLRVGEEIRYALSGIFIEEDFYGSSISGLSITVSRVSVSPDLRNATAFVLPLGVQATEDFIPHLTEMVPQIRHFLSKKISMKYLPNLTFKIDKSYDNSHKINSLLKPDEV